MFFPMWNGFRTINILLGSASIIAATAVWRYRSQGKLTILPKTRPDFSLASLMVSARSGQAAFECAKSLSQANLGLLQFPHSPIMEKITRAGSCMLSQRFCFAVLGQCPMILSPPHPRASQEQRFRRRRLTPPVCCVVFGAPLKRKSSQPRPFMASQTPHLQHPSQPISRLTLRLETFRPSRTANMCVDSFAESLHFSAERVVGVGLAQAEHASKC